ncbi:MAG: DUF2478 domain-containing protein [Burkholderiales bacterium]|nr:DUF2478 domain-containing protein [Burkholderiales bacterium]MDE1928456.1 DUF2478 domain-containing protein [Burkholderiales bacterium]MDE2159062.1 DUF2478 domain-containing protein [Burkholderiales bacterium]MDE2501771.1 DUF2478 domain-containing protein [Burkholderiales bacterium]
MNADEPNDELPAVAAIHNDGSCDLDALLAEFAATQRGAGRRVLGLLMRQRERHGDCRAEMVLTDIDKGDDYLVSQAMGSGSQSCAADPQGFARASRVLRDALAADPDLVICNRYGALEAEGGGFADELLALLAQGVPVLTAVSTRNLEAWRRFVGSAPLLPPQPQAWGEWFDAVYRARA